MGSRIVSILLLLALAASLVWASNSSSASAPSAANADVSAGTASKTAYSCPSPSQLEALSAYCVSKGFASEKYIDANGCTQMRCGAANSAKSTNSAPVKSSSANPSESKTAKSSSSADSKTSVCPVESNLQKYRQACEAAGKTALTYKDVRGCSAVRCETPAKSDTSKKNETKTNSTKTNSTASKPVTSSGIVNCKKQASGACVYISCDDGFVYNSCAKTSGSATSVTSSAGKTSSTQPTSSSGTASKK